MANNTRSPNEIERENAEHRAALAANISALRDKLSVKSIVGDAVEEVRAHSGEIGKSFSYTLRENPVPATLIAVGLGWMMFSQRRNGFAGPPPQLPALREDTSLVVAEPRPTPPPPATPRRVPSWAAEDASKWDDDIVGRR
ncbi:MULTISPECIES: DUF3618 domain-containing protein [unclassified Marinovum]